MMKLRALFVLWALWPGIALAQPICPCLECLNPRIESFYMTAGSMKPTLEIDQCFRMVRFDEGERPSPGQIIVFQHPVNGTDFVKRVIAEAGQTVQMRGGRLWVDGTEVPWREAGTYEQPVGPQGTIGTFARCAEGQPPCTVNVIQETLGGVSYLTLDIGVGLSSLDETGVFQVPEGHLFVLGDNRDNSTDSRVPLSARGVGFVPLENVRGWVRTPE